MYMRKSIITLFVLSLVSCASDKNVKIENNSVIYSMPQEKLKISAIAPNIFRIQSTKEEFFAETKSDIVILAEDKDLDIKVLNKSNILSIYNSDMKLEMDKITGSLTFKNINDTVLFAEPSSSPRIFNSIEIKQLSFDRESTKKVETVDGGRVNIEATESGVSKQAWTIQQNFLWSEGEALYGLGSHEEDVLNLRGSMQYLYQQNMKAVVPVLVSSKGYGILFDANCEMEFRDDSLGSFVKIDAVEELDYYVIYGPEFDDIVAGYRKLTGTVPMLPRWAFGYCQSKERYKTQEELLSVLEEYRKRELPIDLIIQDWQYWSTGWGIKEFDSVRYPDPTEMCEKVHDLNAHIMLSIWPIISGDHPEKEYMQKAGHMLGDNTTYNAYNAEARDDYWKYANTNLFNHGIDAWWCDCTEPIEADWTGEVKPSPKKRRDLNIEAQRKILGRERVNSYSLLHSKGIYENQRKTTDEKRVINLTRSAYAGQQRYATISWSGDISAKWKVLKQQISAGLNFTATGCPYWTNDIGAFFVKKWSGGWFWDGDFQEGVNDFGYRELYTRWFQYGAFLPIFRSHGTDTPREIWQFGEPGSLFYDALVKALHLRYQLYPYTYSLAGITTQEHYTMMRTLAFDFRNDPKVHDVKTQYMYGPAFMVCPVTEPMYYDVGSKKIKNKDKTREVYLPQGANWYDFWTNVKYKGGESITANAPIEHIPLFVREGSIVPFAPVMQYNDEYPDAEWTIRIYPGADGKFKIYEDSGDGYDYEKGEFSTWELNWNNESLVLNISERKGNFPEMVKSRKLKLILISKNTQEKEIHYTGNALKIDF